MPIHWEIRHPDRLVIATTKGMVTLTDVEHYLDALVTEGAMPYAKIFDATDIDPKASDHDVMMLAARMRAYVATIEGGPLAFVLNTPEARGFVDRYINLTAAPRPVRVFKRIEDATRWIRNVR